MPRYAAIDIGSNSVRMQAAEVMPGVETKILASDREVTRLGTSVFASGRIDEQSIVLVCQVLRRMAQTYQKLDVAGIRAVATSAVRDASNQMDFIRRAEEAIAAPVEIISGQEEARLIHLGVQSRWAHPKGRILILDVGGGSAELIVGENGDYKDGVSRPLGAVRLTEVFLKTDPPTPTEIQRLLHFIDEKLEPAIQRISVGQFDRFIATSATAAAIVAAVNQIPRAQREQADMQRARTTDVRALFQQLSGMRLAARKKVSGIGPRRAEIIVAGVAVFLRVLESLKLRSLYYSTAGVRDGITADLAARGVGRELSRAAKPQLRVLEAMCRKYSVDLKGARHIAGFTAILFEALQPLHKLTPDYGKLLEAAAYLHNTGHFISSVGHHKHSHYVVMNSDLPGFTDMERQLIAMLCRYHRKSMPTVRHESFLHLAPDHKRAVSMLTPLLRMAVALDTSKQQRVASIQVQPGPSSVTIQMPSNVDADLELWAAERAGDSFREMYGIPLSVMKTRR